MIVPVLNEAESIPALLASLAAQEGVHFKLYLVDGHSSDRSRDVFEEVKATLPFVAEWLAGPRGRGAQMNLGAKVSGGPRLLFLHADSTFSDPLLFKNALSALNRFSTGKAAGHFGITFESPQRDFFYHFYEAKSRTSRPGTVNGDQGLLIDSEFFLELGGFDETLPFFEDAKLETLVNEKGGWVLLPGALHTSPRRFVKEGRFQRQVVNAILRNLHAIGRPGFLAEAKRVYADSAAEGRFRLLPQLKAAIGEISREGAAKRLALWYATGGYVRSNGWQLFFLVDCLIERLKGLPPGGRRPCFTLAAQPIYDFLTDNPPGRFIAMVLTMAAFRGVYLWAALTDPT